MIIRKLKDLIPKPLGDLYNEYKWLVIDNYEVLSGKRDQLTPPARLIFVGDGDFSLTGKEFVDYFINLCDLKPYESILDVGCGIGRMAVPLTRYIDKRGSYDGIDIVEYAIDWCTKNIHKRYPNFRFHHADILNVYNLKGKKLASDFEFPFNAETFDFVFLTSVFTHMLQADFENYSNEIARVLKKDGRSLITFFLLNNASLSLNEKSRNYNFMRLDENISVISKEVPELAVAYNEEYVKRTFEEVGLKIMEPVYYGNWCGREKHLSHQDIVIARRK